LDRIEISVRAFFAHTDKTKIFALTLELAASIMGAPAKIDQVQNF
jgi:hypothetical protein